MKFGGPVCQAADGESDLGYAMAPLCFLPPPSLGTPVLNSADTRVACGWPWGLYAIGVDYRTGSNFYPSDLQQWVLLSVSRHVLLTRDVQFLARSVQIESGEIMTVMEALDQAFQQFQTVIGFGEHGLTRLLFSDHNDGFLFELGRYKDHPPTFSH